MSSRPHAPKPYSKIPPCSGEEGQSERRPPLPILAIDWQHSSNLAARLLLLLLVERFRHTFWIKPSLDNCELEPTQTWASRWGIMLFSELLVDSEEKHLRWSAAALQMGALASGAAHSFMRAPIFISNWFCPASLLPDYARGVLNAAWWCALRTWPVLHLSLS